ncbi:MAG: glutaredoxin family protein [Acidimicrobiia bacterium]|nr:glutaredoxin family protein [Acidimicrobiia bacterium]MYF84170.1 glutaredoxin family protein [Acidimicrobiia bacterium]
MRDYLEANSVEFDDRNIRQSDKARQELLALTGDLVVPYLIYEDQRVTGFDPDGLDAVTEAYRAAAVGVS